MIISALGWNDYMTKFSTQGWVQPRGWKFNPASCPGLKILSCNRAFDFDRVLYYRQGWNFNPVNRAEFNPGVENAPCNRPLTMCPSAPTFFHLSNARQFYSSMGKLCSFASNIAVLSHNIAILIGRLLWAICNRREQIASWNSQKICKQSLWLDYKKKGSTNPVAQTIGLASLFLIIQSETLFTNLLWISNLQFVPVGCKLLRAICLSKLQYCGTILQCCLQENIQFDCNGLNNHKTQLSTPF
jgi:hypothetical protein